MIAAIAMSALSVGAVLEIALAAALRSRSRRRAAGAAPVVAPDGCTIASAGATRR